MGEKSFVESIQRSAKIINMDAFVWKTNDRFTLGIPDLVIIIEGVTYAIEAKAADLAGTMATYKRKLPQDIPCLKHPFSGTQVSVLRQMMNAGAFAFGIIQISPDSAYLVHPEKVPKGGNFTHRELAESCPAVKKRDHTWRITEWPSLLCLTEKKKQK